MTEAEKTGVGLSRVKKAGAARVEREAEKDTLVSNSLRCQGDTHILLSRLLGRQHELICICSACL